MRSIIILFLLALSGLSYGQKGQPVNDKYCHTAGSLDVGQLNAQDAEIYQHAEQIYEFFDLAESISKNPAYVETSNRLVLQLMCQKGLFIPSDTTKAIKDINRHWQSGKRLTFNPCQYISDSIGGNYCAVRGEKKENTVRDKKLTQLISALPNQQLVFAAYQVAMRFIDDKVTNAEIHGGAGHVANRLISAHWQKDEYLERLDNVLKGQLPDNFPDPSTANKTLEQTIVKVMARLREDGWRIPGVTLETVQSNQTLWKTYRDNSATMLAKLNNTASIEQWKALLTMERIEDLNRIIDFDENAP